MNILGASFSKLPPAVQIINTCIMVAPVFNDGDYINKQKARSVKFQENQNTNYVESLLEQVNIHDESHKRIFKILIWGPESGGKISAISFYSKDKNRFMKIRQIIILF